MPTDIQMAEWIVSLTGYALYVPVIFFIVEAIKQWVPESLRTRILPTLSVVVGAVIVYMPTIMPNETIELIYRGGLIGAALTGFVAWRHGNSSI